MCSIGLYIEICMDQVAIAQWAARRDVWGIAIKSFNGAGYETLHLP